MNRFRPRLTYANAIASLALFIALGGAAVAAGLPKNSIGPRQLKRGAVTARALRSKAVRAGKIAPKAVVAGKLGPRAVLPGNLGPGIIGTSKISAGAVIAAKIRNNVVTTNKLNHNAVTTQKLANDSVTTAKLAEGAVDSGKLADGAVTATKLAPEVLNNVSPLKAGQTLRGVFDVGGIKGTAKGSPSTARGAITLQQPLTNTPAVTVVAKGGPYPTQCQGPGMGEASPTAAPGYLCIYLTTTIGLSAGTPLTTEVPSRLGIGLVVNADPEGEPEAELVAAGVWAVTAPQQ
jgi:hypothetical protein